MLGVMAPFKLIYFLPVDITAIWPNVATPKNPLSPFKNNLFIKEQVALNKSSLLLKIQKQNAQTLRLFIKIIKRESIYKSNQNIKPEGLRAETKRSN